MIVELPESYVAFVLSNAKQKPDSKELEALRVGTIEYLEGKLRTHYPSLKCIDLVFGTSEFQGDKPEPRFNLYLEAQTSLYFQGKATPDKNEVFQRFISSFDRDYLLQKVRMLGAPNLKSAVEVQARRLKRTTPGGAVKVPAFYMGFVLSEDPTQQPTQQQQDAVLEKTRSEAMKLLRDAFKDDFDDLELKIVRTAIGKEAGKPDAQYNLYVEFECVAFFAQNTPEPMDVFSALSQCLSMEFIMGLQRIGGFLTFITQMVIRLCIFIEVPLLEEEEGEGEGEGEKLPIIVKVHVEFFVALVIRTLGDLPSAKQLHEFDALIQDFFSAVLAKAYPKGFVDLLLEADPEFGSGLPLPRFNMLHQYKATMQFYAPPPDGAKLLKKLLQGNLGPLYEKIKTLSSPWCEATEVTMGKAVERPATDAAFGGKIEEEEAPPEEEKKEVTPPGPTPPPPPKKVEKPTPPPAPKPAPKPVPKEQPVPEESEPEEEETVVVGTSDVFVAFTIPNCDFGPYKREYEALAATTRSFYASHLSNNFASCFRDVQVSVGRTHFGRNMPNDKYNVYLEWDMEASFQAGPDVPDRYQLCRSLVQTDLMVYLCQHVRMLEDTPFAGATGMFTEQVNS